MDVATLLITGLGCGDRIAVRAYDGSRAGPADAVATIVVRDSPALSRVVLRPDELGLARAFVTGDQARAWGAGAPLELRVAGWPRSDPELLAPHVRAELTGDVTVRTGTEAAEAAAAASSVIRMRGLDMWERLTTGSPYARNPLNRV